MKVYNREDRPRCLEKCMTVGDLRAMLEDFDNDSKVLLTSDYGDYHHTEQALPIESVELLDEDPFRCLATSGYSQSGVAIQETHNDELDDDYDPSVEHAPAAGNDMLPGGHTIQEGDILDDEIEVVLLRTVRQ